MSETTSMGNPQCSLPKNHEGDHLPGTGNITHKCGTNCMWCDSQCKYELVTFQAWHGEEKEMPDIELEDPKLILEVIDKLTVQARCNKCKSDDIAVIIKRISLNER